MGDGDKGLQGARRMSSPEELNDYLKVTNPSIWVLLVAIVLFIGGFLIWSGFTSIESYATGTTQASGGELTVTFDDSAKAGKVLPGMEAEIGDVQAEILAVGKDANGNVIASARASLPDGSYDVRVGYEDTQVLSMLLN